MGVRPPSDKKRGVAAPEPPSVTSLRGTHPPGQKFVAGVPPETLSCFSKTIQFSFVWHIFKIRCRWPNSEKLGMYLPSFQNQVCVPHTHTNVGDDPKDTGRRPGCKFISKVYQYTSFQRKKSQQKANVWETRKTFLYWRATNADTGKTIQYKQCHRCAKFGSCLRRNASSWLRAIRPLSLPAGGGRLPR